MCGKRWINSAVTTWKFMVTNNILEALFVKLVRVNIPCACSHRSFNVSLPVLSSLYCYIGFCEICKCNLRNKSWILCHNHNSTKSQFQCQNIPWLRSNEKVAIPFRKLDKWGTDTLRYKGALIHNIIIDLGLHKIKSKRIFKNTLKSMYTPG